MIPVVTNGQHTHTHTHPRTNAPARPHRNMHPRMLTWRSSGVRPMFVLSFFLLFPLGLAAAARALLLRKNKRLELEGASASMAERSST